MKKLIFLAALLAAAPLAEAKKKKAEPKNPGRENEVVVVEVPRSELDVKSRLEEDSDGPSSQMELGVSTFGPRDFTRSTYAANASKFAPKGVPFLALNRVAPIKVFPGNGAGLFWIAGASYSQLERSGEVRYLSSTHVAEQTLSLLSLRAGLEYQGPRFASRWLAPFVSLSALPTYEFAAESELEGRVSNTGVLGEGAAGILVRPTFLKEFLSVYDGTIKFGAHRVIGNLGGSAMAGTGFLATISATL